MFLKILIAFLSLVGLCSCQNPAAEQYLLGQVLTNYNKNMRPSSSVLVNLRFYLRHIAIDGETNKMTTSFQLIQHWTDGRFKWNSTFYDNTSHLMMPAKNVWLPDTFIYNTVDSNGYLPLYDNSLVLISSTSTVYHAVPLLNVNTNCNADLFYYPFDNHTCSIIFTSWMQSSSRLVYAISSSTVFMNMFQENADWEITGHSMSHFFVEPKFPPDYFGFSSIKVEFHLRRRFKYTPVLHLAVPCLILNVAMVFSYLMPFAAQITLSKKLNNFFEKIFY